jgi:DNA primase
VYFSARGETKLDLARYYLNVSDGTVRALAERPCMLHRFPNGVDGDKVHQKRIPSGAPAMRLNQLSRRAALGGRLRRRALGAAVS